MKTHCMVDLETLGTLPGSVIVSIGAAAFDQHGIRGVMYSNVSIDSCLAAGLIVDGGALEFWLRQTDDAARKALFASPPRGLRESLAAFTAFYQHFNCEWLWCHGANFDVPLLDVAYSVTGHTEWRPWRFRNLRDTRTLYSLLPSSVVFGPQADKHNALADAEYQARCVIEAYIRLGKELPDGEPVPKVSA
jgi:3' exoribonuclease, RNase T-like